uniref:DUF617 domain-containing protein n=1 Tax=Leersia perrieri TaxID=77586 RepID=A0A0D9WA49_9ORYZ
MADASRRTRPAADDGDDDDDVSKKPILMMASPSPSRAVAGRTLEAPPTRRRPGRRSRPARMFHTMCRSLPVLTPRCGRLMPPAAAGARLSPSDSQLSQLVASSTSSSRRRRMTGTLFGYRDGRVALSLQENPRCHPTLVVELALPTHALLRDLGATAGARIVLESEKKHDHHHGHDEGWVLEEAMWTMYCNGKRVGYAARRGPTEDDIAVLETLWAVSMGGGVLPGMTSSSDNVDDGEMAYMRGCFEHVIGSKDSESLYMVGPHGGDCPELAVFFVRL